MLWLGDASAFKGSIQDFGTGDEIALAGFDNSTLHPLEYTRTPPERAAPSPSTMARMSLTSNLSATYNASDFAPMAGSGSTIIGFA